MDNYLTNTHEAYEWITKERKHLYGVKTKDSDDYRCLVVCKTKEMAEHIEYYLEKYLNLFFTDAENKIERDLVQSKEFHIVTDLNSNLDYNKYVSIHACQLEDKQEFFKEYIINDELRNKIVEIEVINYHYIFYVID